MRAGSAHLTLLVNGIIREEKNSGLNKFFQYSNTPKLQYSVFFLS